LTANGTIEPIYLCLMPGPFGFVGGMWFIYLVMAPVHIAA